MYFGVEFESWWATDADSADSVGVTLDEFVAFGFDVGDGFAGAIGAMLTSFGAAGATTGATIGFGGGDDGRRRRPIGVRSHPRAFACRLRGGIVLQLVTESLGRVIFSLSFVSELSRSLVS